MPVVEAIDDDRVPIFEDPTHEVTREIYALNFKIEPSTYQYKNQAKPEWI